MVTFLLFFTYNSASNEINRTTRGKSFQTLEDIKRNNSKVDAVPIDNIREFLQETNNSFCSELTFFDILF